MCGVSGVQGDEGAAMKILIEVRKFLLQLPLRHSATSGHIVMDAVQT
jgi:hypothetical protein